MGLGVCMGDAGGTGGVDDADDDEDAEDADTGAGCNDSIASGMYSTASSAGAPPPHPVRDKMLKMKTVINVSRNALW